MPILPTLLERAWLWFFRGLWKFVVDNDTHWQSRGQWQFVKKYQPPFSWLPFHVSFIELSWFPWTESRLNIIGLYNWKNLDKSFLYYNWDIHVLWLENISSSQPLVPLGLVMVIEMPPGGLQISSKMNFCVLILIYQENSTKLYLSVLANPHLCVLK